MPGIYRYTGKPFSSFSSWNSTDNEYSAANAIVVTITTPTALPPNLALGDALPPGIVVSIGDGKSHYDNAAPGEAPYPLIITLSVQLSTGPSGEIVAWNIDLSDEGVDGVPHQTSLELQTSGGLPEPASPKDQSSMSLSASPEWWQGSTDVSGEWSQQ